MRVIPRPGPGASVLDILGEPFVVGGLGPHDSYLCGGCGRVLLLVPARADIGGAGSPVVARCAVCGSFNDVHVTRGGLGDKGP